jgi:hypothetical protein
MITKHNKKTSNFTGMVSGNFYECPELCRKINTPGAVFSRTNNVLLCWHHSYELPFELQSSDSKALDFFEIKDVHIEIKR